MWPSFFLTLLLAFLILYLPGYLFFTIVKAPRTFRFIAAPVFSLGCYCIIPLLLSYLNIECSWETIFLPTLCIGLACFLVGKVQKQRSGEPRQGLSFGVKFEKGDTAILLFYLTLSLAVGTYVFIKSLDGAASFTEEYDNYFHLGVVRSFLETGDFSFFNIAYYPEGSETPWGTPSTTSYPALWHVFTALVISLANCPLTVGANATNAMISSVFFSANIFLFVKVIFRSRKFLIAGALCSTAFAAFPWGLLMFGPLYPNLTAFAILPLFFSFVILLFENRLGKTAKLVLFTLALSTLCLAAAAHPNSVFSTIAFLLPFFCWKIANHQVRRPVSQRKTILIKTLQITALAVAFGCAWCLLYKAPFLQGVIGFNWPSFASKSQALVNVVAISFTRQSAPQLLLGTIVILGVAFSLFKRKFLWISIAYLIVTIIYIFGTTSEGFLKHFLIGFWYTDSYRVAAMIVLFAIPVAVMGMVFAFEMAKQIASRAIDGCGAKVSPCILACILGAVFLAVNYYPNFTLYGNGDVKTGFGIVKTTLELENNVIYDQEEKQFISQVKEIVNEDDLILNDPFDGSVFLYGSDNLNIYYRQFHKFNSSSETEESKLIRNRLADCSTDEQVSEAVNKIGADYLLLLDLPDCEDASFTRKEWDPYGIESEWRGLYEVNDNTSGFEIVLKYKDMRLYKIA